MTGQTVLRVKLDVPFECRFTKADAFNGLPTYPIPPVTTIRGLCYAALNRPSMLNQDSKPYTPDKDTIDIEKEFRKEFEEKTKISVQAKGTPKEQLQTDLRKRMKVGRSSDDKAYRTYVTQEQSIISPTYIAYIHFDDAQLQDAVKSALSDPERLLYLGRSDDLVDISVTEEQFTKIEECSDTIYAPIDNESNVEDPLLLPIKSDYKGTYTTRPAQSRLISKQSNIPAKQTKTTKECFEFF